MNYGDFQLELYFAGLTGVRPSLPVTASGMEERARAAMSTEVWSYVAGGAGSELTQDVNVTAFDRYGVVPRMLAGVAQRDLSTRLLGLDLPTPLLLAPIGVIGLWAHDGHRAPPAAPAAPTSRGPQGASTPRQGPPR